MQQLSALQNMADIPASNLLKYTAQQSLNYLFPAERQCWFLTIKHFTLIPTWVTHASFKKVKLI